MAVQDRLAENVDPGPTKAIDKPSHTGQPPCPGGDDAASIASLAGRSLAALLELARPEPGDLVVVGCSTSEIRGQRIGSAGSPELACHLFGQLKAVADEYHVGLAIQCCEHLNRALVVDRKAAKEHRLVPVTVWPRWNAGGALAAAAIDGFDQPVVVESVSAVAGIDIGHTLIGMHLCPVAVPVRLPWRKIGEADLVLARTRPRLIGGTRAVYSREEAESRAAAEHEAAARSAAQKDAR
ncbi:MAG: TIGR01440 family protein [Bacillota bacterium]|nr:TIGR01440 family protein [Bacillota bacterium]